MLDRRLREERVERGRGDGLKVFGDDEREEGRCAAVLREVGVGVGHDERAEGDALIDFYFIHASCDDHISQRGSGRR